MHEVTIEQAAALAALGIETSRFSSLGDGEWIVFELQTESDPGIAMIRKAESRISAGILFMNDPGGGLKTMLRFRGGVVRIAETFGASQVELFGGAVINPKLKQLLVRQGFREQTIPCPLELGGGDLEIMTRIFEA